MACGGTTAERAAGPATAWPQRAGQMASLPCARSASVLQGSARAEVAAGPLLSREGALAVLPGSLSQAPMQSGSVVHKPHVPSEVASLTLCNSASTATPVLLFGRKKTQLGPTARLQFSSKTEKTRQGNKKLFK